ncbi:hypothetical protein Z517_10143 [Fonsecaea pedrosoi CBS 271.37]|uniref:Unplaced genomic scaffold supercont1.7, whole genome shotgun sequence n=1 Tax=Fonsecaea pedrosoi CBS 271.37 TaxID=1442368 RepID=A0A0D2ELY4_9EURO|nr:uncharacterized protein Z517_10143 [Fonsecaea pedrosoi CBS 271.37]KIW75402.1 hypothetical protein Z517_10143 [Fonsecaea pedrosoi CBS 271.37]
MPNRKDAQDLKPSPKAGSGEPGKSRVRIGRACDRCKIKKSKRATTKRGKRLDVLDEALQRLYWACREGRGFPGVIPDESGGRVSTDAILRGLGLSPPPIDDTRVLGSRSDSVLDMQAHSHHSRSYRPPDLLSPDLSRNKPPSSAMTPLSTTSDDRLTFVEPALDGGAGRRRRPPSAMDVDKEGDLSDGPPEAYPDGLGQQFQESLGGGADSAMLQDGDMGVMEGTLYPDMSAMSFGEGGQPSPQSHRIPMQPVASQFHLDGLPQDRYRPGGQQGWQGRVHQVGSMLPWPGNMASMYRTDNQDDSRDGFDELGQGGR